MDSLFYGVSVLIFLAVALAVDTMWEWWASTRSKAARRFQRRIHAMTDNQDSSDKRISLLKERKLADSAAWDQTLRKMPWVESLDIQLQQAGSASNVGRLLMMSAVTGSLGLLSGAWLLPGLFFMLLAGFISAITPYLLVMRQRTQRLEKMQLQLPEAADLIARSLRAGHALPSTLQMVADEMPEPICSEFRIVSDEISYGMGLQQAMQRLAERVPMDDLRFLVIAVLIQRETGGNLADLMSNLATLIRERLKLLGQVRSLSAEGRLSGWILFTLPIAMGLLLSVLNPGYLNGLFEDKDGKLLLMIAVVVQLLGGLWMRSIVRIRA